MRGISERDSPHLFWRTMSNKLLTSSRYNVILAGTQLVLLETSKEIEKIRHKNEKADNLKNHAFKLKSQLELARLALNFAIDSLDSCLEYYNKPKFIRRGTKVFPVPAHKRQGCFECDDETCNGCCDRANDEEE
jgi:hypothetical protein